MGGGDPEVEAQAAAAPAGPEVIEVQDAKLSAGVAAGKVSLPALKVPKPKPDPTPDSSSSSSSGTATPPADTGTSDTGSVAPTTEVAPVTPQATPAPTPAPNNDPIKVGGGED
jgi:hypothetical protein